MSFPSNFPPDTWFAERDDYVYPINPYLFDFLLTKENRVFKLLKAKQHEESVIYGCILCKQWLADDKVEKHVMGRMHQHQFTFYTDEISKYTLINLDHKYWTHVYKHMCKLYVPKKLTEIMQNQSNDDLPEKLDLLPLYNPETDKPYMIDAINDLAKSKVEKSKAEGSLDSKNSNSRNLCFKVSMTIVKNSETKHKQGIKNSGFLIKSLTQPVVNQGFL